MTTQEIKRLAAILREELKQELDELMSAKQAAEYLGISPAALRTNRKTICDVSAKQNVLI